MSAPQYFLDATQGEDIVLDLTLSSSGFTISSADIVNVYFKMWSDLGANPVVSKEISNGVSFLGSDQSGVKFLAVVPSAEVSTLTPGRAYTFTVAALTSSQKTLSARGSITLSKPNIA